MAYVSTLRQDSYGMPDNIPKAGHDIRPVPLKRTFYHCAQGSCRVCPGHISFSSLTRSFPTSSQRRRCEEIEEGDNKEEMKARMTTNVGEGLHSQTLPLSTTPAYYFEENCPRHRLRSELCPSFDTEYDRAKVPPYNGSDSPPTPGSLKPLLFAPLVKKTQTRNARGMSEVRRGTCSIHFHCPVPRSSSHIGHGIFALHLNFQRILPQQLTTSRVGRQKTLRQSLKRRLCPVCLQLPLNGMTIQRRTLITVRAVLHLASWTHRLSPSPAQPVQPLHFVPWVSA